MLIFHRIPNEFSIHNILCKANCVHAKLYTLHTTHYKVCHACAQITRVKSKLNNYTQTNLHMCKVLYSRYSIYIYSKTN